MLPVLMTEELWRYSHLSVARHYGRCTFNGVPYIIVNKEGKDLFECSAEAEAAGRAMAIEPGEPADLIQLSFKPLYRKLGRDKFMDILGCHPDIETPEDMKKYLSLDVPKCDTSEV